MISHSKPWSTEEDDFLRQYYTSHGPLYCAQILGRTKASVKTRAQRLGVKMKCRLDELPEEVRQKCLKLYKAGFNDREIAGELNIERWAVTKWRRKNKLTAVNALETAVSMTQALIPEQCEVMREFLRFCVTTAKRYGVTDAGKLIRAYREYRNGFVYRREREACG